jgi:hypothetical protein
MKLAVATLRSASPYSQSRPKDAPKGERESHDDYEKRTWRNHLHVTPDGFVFIPAMVFKNCLAETAKFIGMQIRGKGKSTYTKHFEGGVQVNDNLVLPYRAEDIEYERLFLPSDGRRGSGSRVWKNYPVIPQWHGDVHFLILDETITEKVLAIHLRDAGRFVGIGRWRARNNGQYGRFIVEALAWGDYIPDDEELAAAAE